MTAPTPPAPHHWQPGDRFTIGPYGTQEFVVLAVATDGLMLFARPATSFASFRVKTAVCVPAPRPVTP